MGGEGERRTSSGGKLSPSCVSSCPNILASSGAGWDRKSQRRIRSTKQIRLAYLSTPPNPPTCYTSLVSGRPRPHRRRLPSDKSVGVDQPQRRSRRGCEEAEEGISPSHGQIMNKFNSGAKKDCAPAVTGTFHIAVFSMCADNCANESDAYYIFISHLPLLAGSCAPLFARAKKLL